MRLFNTLTSSKEEFTVDSREVKMYVCGPTTYNYIHLGNARPLVVFDTVRRYLDFKGYNVNYVQNFTDVDDKIINRAAEENMEPLDLAARYIDEYFVDADALGIKRAQVYPRVSDHITDIIEAISKLIQLGYAYQVDGDVYYRVKAFTEYGKLSHRSLEDMLAGARVEIDNRKEEPVDFALWKEAKPGELFWSSPWGDGRPGWHIECSVMSTRYLGDSIDIHGGGSDLIFPHHENEIAQAEPLTGKQFVKYWLHNGFITVNQEKMSKSLGNFFILRDILAKFPPDVVRFYLINTHYRSPLDFDDTKLEEARRALARLKNTVSLVDELLSKMDSNIIRDIVTDYTKLFSALGTAAKNQGAIALETKLNALLSEYYRHEDVTVTEQQTNFVMAIAQLHEKFIEAMDDDFNTAKAIGHLFELGREINIFLSHIIKTDTLSTIIVKLASNHFENLGKIFGFFSQIRNESNPEADSILAALINVRNSARAAKNYGLADRMRDVLNEEQIVIEDTAEGPRCKYENSLKVESLLAKVLEIRNELKAAKNFEFADLIRQELNMAQILIEDTPEGTRWKNAEA